MSPDTGHPSLAHTGAGGEGTTGLLQFLPLEKNVTESPGCLAQVQGHVLHIHQYSVCCPGACCFEQQHVHKK